MRLSFLYWMGSSPMTNLIFEAIQDKCLMHSQDRHGHRIVCVDTDLFAELIVRECAKIIERHDEPSYDGKILFKHFEMNDE